MLLILKEQYRILLLFNTLALLFVRSPTLWCFAFAPFPLHSTSSALFASLESMTVKELRKLVKESSQRGVVSKLKRKQDLINFLQENVTISNKPSPEKLRISSKDMQPRDRLSMRPLFAVTDRSPKEVAFEKVYERYPSIRDTPYLNYTVPADDVRQNHHPVYSTINQTNSDMEVICVGTASCTPGITRAVSCTALRLHWRRRSAVWDYETKTLKKIDGFQGGTWLFDVGECTQLQLQKSQIKPSKITKIFLTHAHGDHSFGLPGVLCLMGQDRDRDSAPVDIYGPEGLRMWLRVAIRYSVSRIVPPYRVHEIMDVPMAPEWEWSSRTQRFYYRGLNGSVRSHWGNTRPAGADQVSWLAHAKQMPLAPSSLYGEIEGGRDIYPSYSHVKCAHGAPTWEVENEEDVKVYAAPMSHSIPCVGYVVDEQPRAGRLRNEFVEPIVLRNIDALRESGFQIPMKVMAVIKNLSPGSEFSFPDGTVVTQEEAVEPERRGRKVVVCGDTCDSRALVNLANNADVVIHEATNCFLPGIDAGTNARSVIWDAQRHGHSTPEIAGRFAREVGAERLILNHFSARYKGDCSVDSLSIMMKIEKIAEKESGLDESKVVAAWDLMTLPVPLK